MASFIDAVKNGIVGISSNINSATSSVKNIVEDLRDPNRIRARLDSADPTSIIDKDESGVTLKFPHDVPKYYMSFGFAEYERPSQFRGLTSKGITDYIALPMPGALRDVSTMNYAEQEGSFVADALGRIDFPADKSGTIEGRISAITGALKQPDNASKVGEIGTGLAARTAVSVLRQSEKLLGNGIVDAGLQFAGIADNPFATVAFKGPNFKSHSFSWRLSPKTKEESNTIRDIIFTFKKVAHPELLSAGAGGFYKYPWVVYPKFNPDAARSYLYDFKPCVITTVAANMAPEEIPGFYAGTSAPVEVVLTIELKEIELWRGGSGQKLTANSLPTTSNGDFENPNIVIPGRSK